MKLHIITLVLDGMPFIPYHLPMLQMTNVDWRWHIVHGAAMNNGSTSWCNAQEARLSLDGTTEYLAIIKHHPRVTIYERPGWISKDDMVNEPLRHITEESVLMEIDVDEIWQSKQLDKIVWLVGDNKTKLARFKCRYFLGLNILSTSQSGFGNNPGEWLRAWHFRPGDNFERHEPPQLRQQLWGAELTQEFTADQGLVFDHYAYAFQHQLEYKERWYGYPNAVSHWKKLQENQHWPVTDLKKFLPWASPGSTADKLSC
jgi:hypothetical protein